MARVKDFIPATDAGFDIFQGNFMDGVQPKLSAWGIPTTEFNVLVSLRLAWGIAWAKAKNKDTRSRADVQAKKAARKAYQARLRKFIREWIAFNSKVTDADREGLGLKVKDIEPTPRPKITVAPFVMLKTLAGARIQVRCRVEEDSTKASRHRNADAIELKYKVVSTTGIGEPAPASPDECTDTIVFSRALHTLKLDIAKSGMRFYGFLRWKNTTDDAKSGPWSKRLQATIAE